MKHSTDELIDIARRYYPRGIAFPRTAQEDAAAYKESEENRRLTAARVEAAAQRGPWRAMLARLREQLPGWDVFDDVSSCPPDALRASYEGWAGFPAHTSPTLTGAEDEDADAILAAMPRYDRKISFCVSFLVPYYVVYTTRRVDDPEQEAAIRERHKTKVLLGIGGDDEPGICWALPRDVVKPELLEEIDRAFEKRRPATRREVRFDFSSEEQPCATTVAREIEATYGYAPMPPEMGRVIVPDVEIGSRTLGEARLYDCLFSDML